MTVHHADGSTEVASVAAPDWFNNGPIAWYAGGRVDTALDDFNNVLTTNPRVFQEDLTLTNTDSAVTSIDFGFGGSGATREVVFGVSGIAIAPVPETPHVLLAAVGGAGCGRLCPPSPMPTSAGGPTLPCRFRSSGRRFPRVASSSRRSSRTSGLLSADRRLLNPQVHVLPILAIEICRKTAGRPRTSPPPIAFDQHHQTVWIDERVFRRRSASGSGSPLCHKASLVYQPISSR